MPKSTVGLAVWLYSITIVGLLVFILSSCILHSNDNEATHDRLSRRQILDQANQEFAAGHDDDALAIINANATPEMLTSDQEIRDLRKRISDKLTAQMVPEQTEANVERLDGYWTEKVKAVPVTPPLTVPEIMQRVMTFEDCAHVLEDANRASNDPKVRASAAKFAKVLRARQVLVFPILRKTYGELIASGVWRENVYVTTNGRTITFSGGLFASNANIADAQASMAEKLGQLRFSKARYTWYQGARDSVWYDLKTPADSQIGYWADGSFSPVAPFAAN